MAAGGIAVPDAGVLDADLEVVVDVAGDDMDVADRRAVATDLRDRRGQRAIHDVQQAAALRDGHAGRRTPTGVLGESRVS